MKSHNKYKNVVSRLKSLLMYTEIESIRRIRFGLRTALTCLTAQNKKIKKLEEQVKELEEYKHMYEDLCK